MSDALFTCGYVQTCLNCSKFDEAKELCKAAGARPPARVIAFGCEAFTEDEEEDVKTQAQTLRANIPPPPPPNDKVVRRLTGFDDLDDDIPF